MLPLFAAALSGFVLVAQTPRADYYTLDKKLRVDVKSCESFLVKAEQKLGVTLPHFEYYRVASPSDVFRYSADRHYGGGFANVSPLFTVATEPCMKHELVHLATYQLGRAPHVFEEGLASLLAGDYELSDRFDGMHYGKRMKLRFDPMNRLFVTYTGSDAYRVHIQYIVSQEFVRALVKKAGLATMCLYFRDARDATFTALYGATPQAAFDRWLYGDKARP